MFSPGTPVFSINKTNRHDIIFFESGVKHHNANPTKLCTINRCLTTNFLSNQSFRDALDITRGAGTVYHSVPPGFTPIFGGVPFNRSLVLCVCFVDRCLSFSLWPLCCLSSYLRILITLLYLQTLLKIMYIIVLYFSADLYQEINNFQSHFIDLSHVYANTVSESLKLRELVGGEYMYFLINIMTTYLN